jgi:hypothetical protein
VAAFGRSESVDTLSEMAGFDARGSVDTSGEIAEYEVAAWSSADLDLSAAMPPSPSGKRPQHERSHTTRGTSCLNRVFALAGA